MCRTRLFRLFLLLVTLLLAGSAQATSITHAPVSFSFDGNTGTLTVLPGSADTGGAPAGGTPLVTGFPPPSSTDTVILLQVEVASGALDEVFFFVPFEAVTGTGVVPGPQGDVANSASTDLGLGRAGFDVGLVAGQISDTFYVTIASQGGLPFGPTLFIFGTGAETQEILTSFALPEPGTATLLLIGALGLACWRQPRA